MRAPSPATASFDDEDRQDPSCFVQPPVPHGQRATDALDELPNDPRCFVRPAEAESGRPPARAVNRHTRKASGIALTAREGEVARLLAAHYSNRDVARQLHISTRTVEHHVQSVLERLGLRSRFQVTAEVLARHEAPVP